MARVGLLRTLKHTSATSFDPVGDQHVASVGANLAVVKELDHDDRVRFSGGNKHRADGVELRAAAAEGLGQRAVDGCKNNRNSCNSCNCLSRNRLSDISMLCPGQAKIGPMFAYISL